MQDERQDVTPEDGTPDAPLAAPSFQRRLAAVILTAIGVQLLFLVFRAWLSMQLCGLFEVGNWFEPLRQFESFYSAKITSVYFPNIAMLILEGTILTAATYYGCTMLSRDPSGTTRLRAAVYIVAIYLIALVLMYYFHKRITVDWYWTESWVDANGVYQSAHVDGYRRSWSWIPLIVGVIAPAWAWSLLRPRRVDADKAG